jgi:hypothetical protein
VVHASVPELRDVQRVICTEAVGIHDAIGPNPLADDGQWMDIVVSAFWIWHWG